MKVFMLHAGDPLDEEKQLPEDAVLQMKCFNDGQIRNYSKKDIINATSQMVSLERSGVRIQYGFLTNRRSLIALLKAGLRLRRLIEREDIELVHVLWGVTTSLITVAFSPGPVVISFCGSDLYGTVKDGGKRGFSAKITNLLSQISGLFATSIIVKSSAMLNDLWMPNRKKATTIPNGVDMDLFHLIDQGKARQKLLWSSGKKYILFFPAGGSPVKDPQLAKAAFSYVKGTMPECELIFVENVPHEELTLYYNAADVMLITSIHEGSNNSLKEAMCCNLPIVSVCCGDAMERLASVDQCRVVEGRSPQMIGECLIDVLKGNRRSNGRLHMKNLSLDNVARSVIEVYKMAVEVKRGF